jgi:hypothetical protein
MTFSRPLIGRLLAMSLVFAGESGFALQRSATETEAANERAFEEERNADVVVLYDTAGELRLERPERREPFTTEADLLAFLTDRKERKHLLVVILGKRHEFTNPKQTLEGFWKMCKNTGFDRVVIQQGTAFGRLILHE